MWTGEVCGGVMISYVHSCTGICERAASGCCLCVGFYLSRARGSVGLQFLLLLIVLPSLLPSQPLLDLLHSSQRRFRLLAPVCLAPCTVSQLVVRVRYPM